MREATARSDPRAREEVELENRSVSIVEDRFAAWKAHELPGVSRRERLRFLNGVGRGPFDEGGHEQGTGREIG